MFVLFSMYKLNLSILVKICAYAPEKCDRSGLDNAAERMLGILGILAY